MKSHLLDQITLGIKSHLESNQIKSHLIKSNRGTRVDKNHSNQVISSPGIHIHAYAYAYHACKIDWIQARHSDCPLSRAKLGNKTLTLLTSILN